MMAIYPVIFVLMEANLCCNKMHRFMQVFVVLGILFCSHENKFLFSWLFCLFTFSSCTDMPTYLKVFTLSDDHPFLHFLCADASDEHGVPHWKWCKVIVRRVLQ